MKEKKTLYYPTILSIAGSDSSGGAGIQADLKTISALGGYGTTVITAVTAQNTCEVIDILPIPIQTITNQIEAVVSDLEVDSIKLGMLYDKAIVKAIVSIIKKYALKNLVVDPVLISTSGKNLAVDDICSAYTEYLFPLATIITPNIDEASTFLRTPISTIEEMKKAAIELLKFGSQAVLLKGGHLKGGQMVDVLVTQEKPIPTLFYGKKIETKNTHGTGCTLSSAIATFLAMNNSLEIAVKQAKQYITEAIYNGANIKIGKGNGPVNHFFRPIKMKIKNDK